MKKYEDILKDYLPEEAVGTIADWVVFYKVQLRITRGRTTKLGDYKPPIRQPVHRISINHNLNKYSFLITLVHEFAHLVVWNKYGSKVKPHGWEWKEEFRNLMETFEDRNIFPDDVKSALSVYLNNATASSGSNTNLTRVLSNYDENVQGTFLEDLPEKTIFRIHNGRKFRKMERIKKRYKCQCIVTKKMYLFSPVSRVMPVEQEK